MNEIYEPDKLGNFSMLYRSNNCNTVGHCYCLDASVDYRPTSDGHGSLITSYGDDRHLFLCQLSSGWLFKIQRQFLTFEYIFVTVPEFQVSEIFRHPELSVPMSMYKYCVINMILFRIQYMKLSIHELIWVIHKFYGFLSPIYFRQTLGIV